MNDEITQNEGGLSRRTVVKGAAWSIPVMAAAIAAPAAVATGGPNWDAQVDGSCANDYELSALTALVGAGLVGVVQAALAPLGLTPNASRTFTITALEGTIPAGTQFTLSYPAGLIDLTALETLIEANVLFVATVNATSTVITLQSPMTQGSTATINVIDSIIDLGVASTITMTLTSADNPTVPASEGADSDSVSSLVAAAFNLASLGILGVSGSLAVQICA